jgi:hypothetical protein
MFSRLVAVLLPSSPVRARKGLPSTINCVAVPCFWRCGMPEAVWAAATAANAMAQQATAKQAILVRFIVDPHI